MVTDLATNEMRVCEDSSRLVCEKTLPSIEIIAPLEFPAELLHLSRALRRHIAVLYLITRRCLMRNAIPLVLAALIAVGVIVIGCFYLVSPGRVLGSFGLKPPASDADTLAWLRLKGIRDFAAGLLVLTLMLTADRRSLGIALLALAVIPFGDMSNILVSGGRKATAFSVHGVTCAVMLFAGLLLIQVI
jgi:Domain of unknown function (DUF4267)